jgi:hypothetical protein
MQESNNAAKVGHQTSKLIVTRMGMVVHAPWLKWSKIRPAGGGSLVRRDKTEVFGFPLVVILDDLPPRLPGCVSIIVW